LFHTHTFIIGTKHFYTTLLLADSLQCFDTVGWATGRASGL